MQELISSEAAKQKGQSNMTLPFETHEEYLVRRDKLKTLKELGIDSYPNSFKPNAYAKELIEAYADEAIGDSNAGEEGTTPEVTLAGRLVLFRAMGKNAFAQIQDSTGRIQVMFNRDVTTLTGYQDSDNKPIKVIEKQIDLGDWLGLKGHLFRTGKGELTLYVKQTTLLCKSLLPLPDKYAGLSDKETRYRKRWLDLISSDEVRETFQKRSEIVRGVRDFFHARSFTEVETPVLQSVYGGAEAAPFITKLNALDQEMFLRISLEIPLKKLIVGGLERVFEIGRVFRNEGIDRTHNPEFTLFEAYAAYWDYNDMMACMEELVETLATMLHGKPVIQVEHDGKLIELNLKAPWQRMTMNESLKAIGGVDVEALDDKALYDRLIACGHLDTKKVKDFSRGLMIAALFEHLVEPYLVQPIHITDFPIETTPLCKPHRDPEMRKQGIVERFESFVLGGEICNAYTELNDPIIQKTLLLDQANRKEKGDKEANPLDVEFLEAITQGMPPTGGLGIGIDRLVMLLTSTTSVRDVLFFPWMKPQ